ncbi:hypothetical protein [Donghicola mangrovi]|uniref:Uncharacterized protein n=1 Tax=Donghicola mangrovi TaxID=2729614 RepID=A0A850Q5D5_9RHOB|nr:hypothetical protein [Donghicola mangrovi]NVO23322.1 hypothetical protein [Donghicola mangrovi]
MAAPFTSFTIDVVPAPVIPAYAIEALEKGPMGENLSVKLGYENLDKLLPYRGVRKVVHRSNFAKTGELVARVEADDNLPRIFGVESSLERATAVAALINPNTFDLHGQPRKVHFQKEVDGKKSNTLDFLVTLKTGEKTYLYVKNDDALSREETAFITQQIKLGLPAGCGFATISEASFHPQVRGNNERIFLAKRFPDPAADSRLAEVLVDIIDVPEFSIEELVVRGVGAKAAKTEMGRVFDAVLRGIADGILKTDKTRLIDYPTRVRRAL